MPRASGRTCAAPWMKALSELSHNNGIINREAYEVAMNSKQKEQLRSTRRERNKIRQLEKKQVVRQSRELEEEITPEDEEQLDDLPVEDTDEEENELATAGVKKDYPMGMDMPAYEPPTVGPTSFGELEEGREAQERARDARVITYDVQD